MTNPYGITFPTNADAPSIEDLSATLDSLATAITTGAPGWRSKFDAATNKRVAVVGDSISRGYWSSGLDTAGYVALVRAALQDAHGDGGSGFKGVGDSLTISGGTVTGYPETVVETGTWNAGAGDSYEGPGSTYLNGNSSDPGTLTFTNVKGTTVRVYCLQLGAGGTFGVTIDGVAKTGIDTAGSSGIKVATYTGLSNTNHTVVITNNGDGGKFSNVCGVSGHNDTGASIDNFSILSRKTLAFSGRNGAGDPPTYGNPALWSGGPSYPVPADLMIYSLGVNDAAANATQDSVRQYVKGWLRSVREGANSPDVLVVMQHVGQVDVGDTNYPAGRYGDYCNDLKDIADTYGAGFLNLWGLGRNNWAYSDTLDYWGLDHTGVVGSNSVHPSDVGHGIIADAVNAALGLS